MKKINKFVKENEAKVGTLSVAAIMIMMMLSSVFVFFPGVEAESGTLTTPTFLEYNVEFAANIYYNHSIYIFGGYNRSGTTEEDDIIRHFPEAYDGHSANETIRIATLPLAKYSYGYALDTTHKSLSEDCVWILGGSSSPGDNDIYCFTFSNETCWNTGHILPYSFGGVSQLAVNETTGIIYMFGGTDNLGEYYSYITAYNFSSGEVNSSFDSIDTGKIAAFAGAYDTTDDIYFMFGGRYGEDSFRDIIVAYSFANHTAYQVGTLDHHLFSADSIACYVPQRNSILIFGGQTGRNPNVVSNNISEFNCTSHELQIINNMSYDTHATCAAWGHNDTNYIAYLAGGAKFDGTTFTGLTDVCKFDLDIAYEEESAEESSSFSLSGLDSNNRITWTGEAGQTVWSNETSYGTLTIQTNINSTDNCTGIYIDIDDFDSTIDADNISIEVRNTADGSWDGTTKSFSEVSGYNITIDQTSWSGNWCHGTNPFPITGAGWTNVTLEVRFKCEIPSGAASGTYVNTSSWNVKWKIE